MIYYRLRTSELSAPDLKEALRQIRGPRNQAKFLWRQGLLAIIEGKGLAVRDHLKGYEDHVIYLQSSTSSSQRTMPLAFVNAQLAIAEDKPDKALHFAAASRDDLEYGWKKSRYPASQGLAAGLYLEAYAHYHFSRPGSTVRREVTRFLEQLRVFLNKSGLGATGDGVQEINVFLGIHAVLGFEEVRARMGVQHFTDKKPDLGSLCLSMNNIRESRKLA